MRKAVIASALCALFVWQGGAAPGGDARKLKWAEGLRAERARAAAGREPLSAETARALTPSSDGKLKDWVQERWDGPVSKSWNLNDSYWGKTDGIDLYFMPPFIGAGAAWGARRELPMSTAGRFAVSSAAGKTCILLGGAGAGEYAGTGMVCYAEDREGANWKTSQVKESGGFQAKAVLDLCWAPKTTSGYVFAATSIAKTGTPKTPLFYYDGPVPASFWVSAVEYRSVPPRTVYDFSAVAPGPMGPNAAVYAGYSGASVGTAQVYYYSEPGWDLLGTLTGAKDVHALYATDTGVLAGTGPRGIIYEWNGSSWSPKPVTGLTTGDIKDIVKVGAYYYAAAANCSPGGEARLFRTRDFAQWEDVTPRATGVEVLSEFVAVAEFGKDGAVVAVGDGFDRFYVSQNPAPANWGVVGGEAGAAGKDVVHVRSGSDFWGNFFGYEKDNHAYAGKLQGFKNGGVLYSSIYDSYDKLIRYKKLEFEGATASGGATFWLRAAADYGEFGTPGGGSGEPAWIKVTPGEPLPDQLSNKRYIQYKVRLDVPDGQKFPPVVKKVRLAMDSTYAKVTGTSPAGGTKDHNVDVPVKLIFSKDIRDATISKENVKINGKTREYKWYFDSYDENTCGYVIDHQDFEAYDEITVTLESIPRREVRDKDGWEIDPDGDGQPGGEYKFVFSVGSGGGGETTGPKVYNVTVEPNPTFGAEKINITATADDTETGKSDIVAAEYSFGPSAAPAGKGTPMEGEFGTPKAEVWAEADIGGVSQGEKRLIVYVRAMDKPGNWGDPTAAPIFIRPPEFLPEEYVYFYPNPCRGDDGYFHYFVTHDSEITVRIFDVRGRLVDKLDTRAAAYSGERGLRWDVSRIGADVYIFQFTARALATGEVATVTKKLAVLK